MRKAVIIIGVNEWERYTLPCIQSLQAVEPGIDIIVVDNGSKEPYPAVEGAEIVRIDDTVCYAKALNYGIVYSDFQGKFDWLIITNNDVLFHKPFSDKVDKLSLNNLYGFYIHQTNMTPWLSGWCMFIPKRIHGIIGDFDEKFTPMWFEDADYSIRATNYGFGMFCLNRDDWGIQHLASTSVEEKNEILKKNQRDYDRNLKYLKEKHHGI